jgi:phosphomannomutase
MNTASPTLKFSISGLRGVYPDDISPDQWIQYVRAFAAVLPQGPVAIARDARATGPGLLRIATGVLTLLGREVHDLGLVSTPTIKAFVNARKMAGGLMVSASHNPAAYNALKFIKKGGMFFDAEDNRRFVAALDAAALWGDYRKQGSIVEAHAAAIDLHIASILKVVKKPKRRLKAVIDPVGSCGGEIAVTLLARLGVKCETIHLAETSSFPRPPEPTAPALKKLAAAVKKYRADVGFAFDPDADRLSIVDEKGRAIGEEYTLPLAILAGAKKNTTVVVNLSTSMLSENAAAMRGCRFVRSAVGEANVVAKMQQLKAPFGGEGNGGVIDARIPSYGRDALAGLAHIVALIGSGREPLSAWVASIAPTVMVKKTAHNISPAQMSEAVERARHLLQGAVLDTTDGYHLSGNMPGGGKAWVHLRSSNTEPLVRIIAEAGSKAEVESLIAGLGL